MDYTGIIVAIITAVSSVASAEQIAENSAWLRSYYGLGS
jgi:hypothetical protein